MGLFFFQVEYRALLKSSFRLHLKIEPSEKEKVKHIFFKPTIHHLSQHKMMSELFPGFLFTFNTRHPVPTVRSNLQVADIIIHTLFWKLGIWWRWMLTGKFGCVLMEPEFENHLSNYNPWFMNMSLEEMYVRWYCMISKVFFNHQTIYSKVILYEDLFENPRKVLQDIFSLLHIDHSRLDLALAALEKDSQNKTFGERGKKHGYKFDKELWDNFDDILMEYDLPFTKNVTSDQFKTYYQ